MSNFWGRIAGIDSRNLALRLTLLALVLHPIGVDWIRLLVLGLAVTGLLVTRLFESAALWGTLTLATGSRVLLDWPLADNHAYLLSYWCLAITLSCFARDRNFAVAVNARWMIALVFGFASLWKLVLAPDFIDGTFFRVTLMTDPRFEGFARLVGDLSLEQVAAAREALRRHADSGMLEFLSAATPTAWIKWSAFALTGWTLTIEIAVSATFFWPLEHGPSKFRDAALIGFCASTYAVATVDGFAWLLIAMGVAQCEVDRPRTRAAYLATFVLILFYREIPWLTVIANHISRA